MKQLGRWEDAKMTTDAVRKYRLHSLTHKYIAYIFSYRLNYVTRVQKYKTGKYYSFTILSQNSEKRLPNFDYDLKMLLQFWNFETF